MAAERAVSNETLLLLQPNISTTVSILAHTSTGVSALLILITNGLIVAAIVRYESLHWRKEYIVVAALALADAWNAAGSLAAGIYRGWMAFRGWDMQLVTNLDCLLTVHGLLWIHGSQISHWMLTCVSLDRLLAIVIPLRYYAFTPIYAYRLTGLFYLGSIVYGTGVAVYVFTTSGRRVYWRVCYLSAVVGYTHVGQRYITIQNLGGIISILIYVAIPIVYRCKQNALKSEVQSTNREADMKRQRQLTKTCGLSALCTLIFYYGTFVIMVTMLITMRADIYLTLSPFVGSLSAINPIMNFVLYLTKLKDIRDGVKKLLHL